MILLCGTCHKWAHANPDEARKQGFILSVTVEDPSAEVIYTFQGMARFSNDGGFDLVY